MRFRLYRENGALNSPPVFDAFQQGLINAGQEVVTSNEDVAVIWSVLWHGRMRANEAVYEKFRSQGKKVVIIEVGNLFRDKTWRISVDNINGLGKFGNNEDLDWDRPKKLGISLQPENNKRNDSILIASQHAKSLQWKGMPSMANWIIQTVDAIREITDRHIYIRPHPRSPVPGIEHEFKNVTRQNPMHVTGTYDAFNINYDYHCVVNHNSGPPLLAAIAGTPVITGESSLAWPVSDILENIENPKLKNRDEWFVKLTHCEWTPEEIATGKPILRLLPEIST